MTETEREILGQLKVLEATVKQMATANPKPSLLPIFERLDALTRQLRPGSDPQLLHYLHKKSYEKARMHLEGIDPEKGTC